IGGASATPALVSSLSGVAAVGGGNWHSLALKADGTLWAWGWDAEGELGNGVVASTSVGAPAQVLNVVGVSALGVGWAHDLALIGAQLPAAPSGLHLVSLTSSAAALAWTDHAAAASGYVVERKEGSGSYAQVGPTLAANATGFTDATVAVNGSY